MQLDKHATRDDGAYTVTSLYFDTFNLSDYLEKISGSYKRKKIRLRIYEPFLKDSENVFLEIKHKIDMTNRKTKIMIDRKIAEDISRKVNPVSAFGFNAGFSLSHGMMENGDVAPYGGAGLSSGLVICVNGDPHVKAVAAIY